MVWLSVDDRKPNAQISLITNNESVTPNMHNLVIATNQPKGTFLESPN